MKTYRVYRKSDGLLIGSYKANTLASALAQAAHMWQQPISAFRAEIATGKIATGKIEKT